jgi:hypothetical protein
MDELTVLLEAVEAAPVATLSDAVLTERLVDLTAAIDRLTAVRREVAGEWDKRLVWAGDGARSGDAWLAHNTEVSRGRAAAELRVARRLRAMPAVAEASKNGELGAEKVAALTHATDGDRTGRLAELFAAHEAQLVADAKRLTVDQARAAIRYWRCCAADAAESLDAQAQHEAMELRLVPAYDGMVDVLGRLDVVSAAMLGTRLDQVMDERYRAERATVADGGTPRSATQRRADALVELVTRAGAALDDTDADGADLDRPLPLLLVDVPLEALEDRSGKPATLPDGVPLPYDTLARLACEAGIAAIITRAGHLTVDLGRATYTPNRGQRRALQKRDGHCVFPGCDAPATWCDAHHIWPWEHGGRTALWNMALLCRYHHHLVHEGGFRLLADRTGVLHAYRPDGTEINAPPGRRPHQIDPRPPGVAVPHDWDVPTRGQGDPPGMTAAGTAPPGRWDPAHPPDPDSDPLAYRRWQGHIVRRRLGLVA